MAEILRKLAGKHSAVKIPDLLRNINLFHPVVVRGRSAFGGQMLTHDKIMEDINTARVEPALAVIVFYNVAPMIYYGKSPVENVVDWEE